MKQTAKDFNILQEIKKVLDIEIDGLNSVRANLTPQFVTAVEAIVADHRERGTYEVEAGILRDNFLARAFWARMASWATSRAVSLLPS